MHLSILLSQCKVRIVVVKHSFYSKIVSLVLLVLILLTCIYSPRTQTTQVKFHNLSSEQGLSQITARCIYQDSKGFLWVGTQDGLNKYDGYSFTVYRHDQTDQNSLSNRPYAE